MVVRACSEFIKSRCREVESFFENCNAPSGTVTYGRHFDCDTDHGLIRRTVRNEVT